MYTGLEHTQKTIYVINSKTDLKADKNVSMADKTACV